MKAPKLNLLNAAYILTALNVLAVVIVFIFKQQIAYVNITAAIAVASFAWYLKPLKTIKLTDIADHKVFSVILVNGDTNKTIAVRKVAFEAEPNPSTRLTNADSINFGALKTDVRKLEVYCYSSQFKKPYVLFNNSSLNGYKSGTEIHILKHGVSLVINET